MRSAIASCGSDTKSGLWRLVLGMRNHSFVIPALVSPYSTANLHRASIALDAMFLVLLLQRIEPDVGQVLDRLGRLDLALLDPLGRGLPLSGVHAYSPSVVMRPMIFSGSRKWNT